MPLGPTGRDRVVCWTLLKDGTPLVLEERPVVDGVRLELYDGASLLRAQTFQRIQAPVVAETWRRCFESAGWQRFSSQASPEVSAARPRFAPDA